MWNRIIFVTKQIRDIDINNKFTTVVLSLSTTLWQPYCNWQPNNDSLDVVSSLTVSVRYHDTVTAVKGGRLKPNKIEHLRPCKSKWVSSLYFPLSKRVGLSGYVAKLRSIYMLALARWIIVAPTPGMASPPPLSQPSPCVSCLLWLTQTEAAGKEKRPYFLSIFLSLFLYRTFCLC